MAVVCLVALHQRWLLLSLVSFLLAIISKEIYLPLFGLVVLYAVYYRNFSLLGWAVVVLVAYFTLRGWHLGGGLASTSSGRNGTGLLTDLLQIKLRQWLDFCYWYINHHTGLLLLAVLALVFSPLRFLFYAGLAAMFLTPLLAAPHAILNPDFHADRLLFPFNLGLVLAIALALGQTAKADSWLASRFKVDFKSGFLANSRLMLVLPWLMVALLLRIVLFPPNLPAFEAQERRQVQQLLNQLNTTLASRAMNNTSEPLTWLVPANFKMGALMDAYTAFAPKAWNAESISLTMNCFTVLQQAGDSLPVVEFWQPHLQEGFQGGAGKGWVARNQLEKECQPLAKGAEFLQIIKPITFGANGHLSWQATLNLPVDEAGFQAGIYLVERGLFIGALGFNERLVRLFPNETYVWVVNSGKEWWFSPLQQVVFE